MKEILIVEKANKLFFYENMHAFINNNERELKLRPNEIIKISNDLTSHGNSLLETEDKNGNKIEIIFWSKSMIEVWEKRNGTLIDENDEKIFLNK